MLLHGFSTFFAASLAWSRSWNSSSTSSVPRTFWSIVLAFSMYPLSRMELGVSGRKTAPIVIIRAGTAARANETLHPHPPVILAVPTLTRLAIKMPIVMAIWKPMFRAPLIFAGAISEST